MKNVQMESKIKKHFNSVSLPEVNVSKKVMNKMINVPSRGSIFLKKKFAIIVLAAIFITGTGFAVNEFINMKDKEGNILWTYREEVDEYADLEKLIENKMNELNLKQGQSVVLYVKENNPTSFMSWHTKPIFTNNILDLQENTNSQFNMPDTLLKEYKFTSGAITKKAKEVDTRKIVEEANETDSTDGPVFVKYIETSDEIGSMSATYSDDKNIINFAVSEWHGNELISQGENSNKNTKIQLEDFQVLYSQDELSHSIIWIKNQMYYKISSSKDGATKDELTSAAKILIELNKEK